MLIKYGTDIHCICEFDYKRQNFTKAYLRICTLQSVSCINCCIYKIKRKFKLEISEVSCSLWYRSGTCLLFVGEENCEDNLQ